MLIPSDPTLNFSQKRTLRRSVAFMYMLVFGGGGGGGVIIYIMVKNSTDENWTLAIV